MPTQVKNVLKNLDLMIAGGVLVVLVAVAVATVISRYIFASPFMWSEEVQTLCFTWITFLGAGAAFRFGAHVSIEFLVDLIPLSLRRYIELIIGLIVSVLICYVLWLSIVYVQQSFMLNKLTTILKIPDYLYCIALPVGCIFMLIGNTSAAIMNFLDSFKQEAK